MRDSQSLEGAMFEFKTFKICAVIVLATALAGTAYAAQNKGGGGGGRGGGGGGAHAGGGGHGGGGGGGQQARDIAICGAAEFPGSALVSNPRQYEPDRQPHSAGE
jgi:hypothetical protein